MTMGACIRFSRQSISLWEALEVRNIKLGLRAFASVLLLRLRLKARVKGEDIDLNIGEIRTL